MEIDHDKIDEVVLALLCLTMWDDRGVTRAWKGQNWDVLNRLFQKGWILDPKNKNKSVVLTEEGEALAQQFFEKHFAKSAGV